jgi:hypothetical protein
MLETLGEETEFEEMWTTAIYPPLAVNQKSCGNFGATQVWLGADSKSHHKGTHKVIIPIPWPLYHLTRGCGITTSAASKYIQILDHPTLQNMVTPSLLCVLRNDLLICWVFYYTSTLRLLENSTP